MHTPETYYLYIFLGKCLEDIHNAFRRTSSSKSTLKDAYDLKGSVSGHSTPAKANKPQPFKFWQDKAGSI